MDDIGTKWMWRIREVMKSKATIKYVPTAVSHKYENPYFNQAPPLCQIAW